MGLAGGDVSIIHWSRWGNHCDCVKMGKSLRFLNPLIEQAIPLASGLLCSRQEMWHLSLYVYEVCMPGHNSQTEKGHFQNLPLDHRGIPSLIG